MKGGVTSMIASNSLRSLMTLSAAAILSLAFTTGSPAAAPNNVLICAIVDGIYVYNSPGTNTCVNAMTGTKENHSDPSNIIYGKTKYRSEADNALQNVHTGMRGVAVAAGLPSAEIQPGKPFASSVSTGTFEGHNSVGAAGAVAANSNLSLTGAVGSALDSPGYGGRVGFNVSW
jgi:hypothetical protein